MLVVQIARSLVAVTESLTHSLVKLVSPAVIFTQTQPILAQVRANCIVVTGFFKQQEEKNVTLEMGIPIHRQPLAAPTAGNLAVETELLTKTNNAILQVQLQPAILTAHFSVVMECARWVKSVMMELHPSTQTTVTATHAPTLAVLIAETLVAVTESSTLENNATKVPTTVTQLQMLAEPIANFHFVAIESLMLMRTVMMEMQADTLDAFAASPLVVMESDNQTRSVTMDQQTATVPGIGAVSIVLNLFVETV